MMNSSPFAKKLKLAFLITLFAGAVFLINLAGFDKPVKNAFFIISSPLQKFFWREGGKLDSFFQTLEELKELKKKARELELKNQRLEAEILKFQELEKENEKLREALGLGLEKEFALVATETIAKDPFEDSILINKGQEDGIKEGWPVITSQKALVGRVEEVFQNFSRVTLISNKKLSFDAKILLENEEILGLVRGKGNLTMVFDLVPQDKKIESGAKVITTTLGGLFPKGLLVGEILTVNYSDVKPFQQAELNPAFKTQDLNFLFAIKN